MFLNSAALFSARCLACLARRIALPLLIPRAYSPGVKNNRQPLGRGISINLFSIVNSFINSGFPVPLHLAIFRVLACWQYPPYKGDCQLATLQPVCCQPKIRKLQKAFNISTFWHGWQYNFFNCQLAKLKTIFQAGNARSRGLFLPAVQIPPILVLQAPSSMSESFGRPLR